MKHCRVAEPSTTAKPIENSSGFTLIEMLVVVCIIVLISSMAMPTVSSYFQLALSSATRGLATTIKEAYNSAVISGRVHRLVYHFKDRNFWVESGSATALMDTKETKDRDERRKKFTHSSDAASPSEFKIETSITRKKVKLPQGVEYEDIITQQSRDPITDGIAYTHFFPHGVTEQTLIHLKDQANHHVSLVISPLIGMTDVYDRYVNATEIFGK